MRSLVSISPSDLDYVRDVVYRQSAIVIDEGKEYLVESRLGPLARSEGLDSIGALVSRMRGPSRDGLSARVVEAMTTNETTFFRDPHPFDALRIHVLPKLVTARKGPRKLRFWSAACSTGQEPYSIAMTMRDHFPELASWSIEIIATDLSTAVLDRA